MENSNENEDVYEDCLEGNEKEENNEKNDESEKKENKEENNNEINLNEKEKEKEKEESNDINNNEQKKEDKYIPFTIKQQQDKLKEEEDSPFPENKGKDSNSESEEDKTPLTEGEKKDIEEKIINERKNAGVLYKNGEYLQALNTYSLLLKDAKRAELKEQCCILNCNKGICFNKLNEYDKALESFKEALKYNKDYSKALCNKMLLLNKKEEYLEAYEDFKRLKTLDYNLWENYRNLEGELNYKAEIQKKKMTDEMLGKLKDMGNTILGKFGLSLNNFQMKPNGQGGYSIQYNNK
jgi:tetratricopeptide (TPR) repeat protein